MQTLNETDVINASISCKIQRWEFTKWQDVRSELLSFQTPFFPQPQECRRIELHTL